MTTTTTKTPFRLLWFTDPHFNFCHEEKIKAFARRVLAQDPDAVVITGDISEAKQVAIHLAFFELQLNKHCPIFFILGNHDFYHGSVEGVREEMTELFTYTEEMKKTWDPRLAWLGSSGVVPLTEDTALVGHDGWYDGRYADWFKSRVWLNDYMCIAELNDRACPLQLLRFDQINKLARESAEYVKEQVEKAFEDFEHVFVATHIPPWPENAVYRGKQSDDDWLPHFSSKHMGDMLLELAKNNPDKRLTVLCGHSHGFADIQHLPNLRAITGEARYKHPKINNVFEL